MRRAQRRGRGRRDGRAAGPDVSGAQLVSAERQQQRGGVSLQVRLEAVADELAGFFYICYVGGVGC